MSDLNNQENVDIIVSILKQDNVQDSLSDGYKWYNHDITNNLERIARLILSKLC